jgi:hypothetical protein
MRALYLFLDRTTGVGRPRHTADEPLPPIRSGAFAAWLASQPAGPRVPAGQRVHAGPSRPNDGARAISQDAAGQGAEQAAGPSNLPAASRP